jgi:hypothetical protein
MTRWLLVAILTLGASCSRSAGDEASAGAAGGYVECVVPRPEICTKEYAPVCGLRDTGIRCVTEPCDTWETKTYGNACSACADGGVYGWRPGECEEEGILRHE